MKICYVGFNAPLLIRLMNYMCTKGHEVHWICLDKPIKVNKGIIIHNEFSFFLSNTLRRNLFVIKHFIKFKKIIKNISPDIIHAVNIKWAGWFAVFSNFNPVIVTAQGQDVMLSQNCDMDFIRMYFRKITLTNAAVITYGSSAMLDDILKWATPQNTVKFMEGVDLATFNYLQSVSYLRKRLGLIGKRVIFSPRMFDENSNLDIIVSTIEKIKNEFPEVVYLFAYHLEINNYSSKLYSLIKEKDLERNCIIIKNIPMNEMPKYYALSDVVLSILASDGYPATVLETMAMRIPIILTKIPTYLEFFKNEKHALFVNIRNVDETTKAIKLTLTNDSMITSIKENAFDWIQENAIEEKCNNAIVKIYEQVSIVNK